MALSVFEKINIAKVSQFLAANQIEINGLYGGGIDLLLPRKLYCVRKNVEWLNTVDSSDDTLVSTSNYLYALCAAFSLRAQSILNPGGTIAPIIPAGQLFPLKVTGANFESDGVTLNDPRLVNVNLVLFVDGFNSNNLYAPAFFVNTATGIQIVQPGFNANDYDEILITKYFNF